MISGIESVWAALGQLASADRIVRKVLELLNKAIGIKDKPPENSHDVPLFFFFFYFKFLFTAPAFFSTTSDNNRAFLDNQPQWMRGISLFH